MLPVPSWVVKLAFEYHVKFGLLMVLETLKALDNEVVKPPQITGLAGVIVMSAAVA